MNRGDTAVIISASNEVSRIGRTIEGAANIPGVDVLVVVDDGSSDETGAEAERFGCVVARHRRNRGKAAAMMTGASVVSTLESDDYSPPRHLLFLDADLEKTASAGEKLVVPLRSGLVDVTIANFTPSHMVGGGHGFVVKLSRWGCERVTGWSPEQPLNGQRAFTRLAFDRLLPLARGYGVETGLNIDTVRTGLRILEVDVPMAHRVTGSDLTSQLHRARQLIDVGLALVPRILGGPRKPNGQ